MGEYPCPKGEGGCRDFHGTHWKPSRSCRANPWRNSRHHFYRCDDSAGRSPETPWPAIGFENAQTSKALPMICAVKNGELILDTRSRSLQRALLVPVLNAHTDSNLAIRALHYLYYLVVARKHGVHVLELAQELPPVLASGGEFEKLIQSFTLVPEALELYKRCQATHHMLELAAI